MLHNLDCQEFIKSIPGNTYQLIIIDAPYGKCTNAKWDEKTFEFTQEFLTDLYRVLTDEGSIYVHCGIGEKSNSLMLWFNQFNNVFHFKEMINWKKNRGMGMRRGWLQINEQILWFVKDNKKFIWNKNQQYSTEKRPFNIVKKGGEMVNKSEYKRLTNCWIDINEVGMGKSPKKFKEIKKNIHHFTPKSPLLSNRMIKLHCQPDSKIFIPFAGSGMEILSCKYNDLQYDATENDPYYYNLILKNNLEFEDFY
jgi:DNA modification methylase